VLRGARSQQQAPRGDRRSARGAGGKRGKKGAVQGAGAQDESDISKLVRMIMARQFDPVRRARRAPPPLTPSAAMRRRAGGMSVNAPARFVMRRARRVRCMPQWGACAPHGRRAVASTRQGHAGGRRRQRRCEAARLAARRRRQ